jgi:hypothetical protein
MVTSEGQVGLFPESCDEGFAALAAFELGAGEGAKLGKVHGTEVWHLVLLPMRPQVLGWIELWRVWRQEFELHATAFACDVIAHEAAAMGSSVAKTSIGLPGCFAASSATASTSFF